MPDMPNQSIGQPGDRNSLRGEFVNIGNVGAITHEHHYYRAAPRRGWLGFGRPNQNEAYLYTPELRSALIKTMENIIASANRNHEQQVYLEMGLREVPSLVSPTWRRHVQGDTSERAISEGQIPALFDTTAKLLILGAPGAGKTVQLYRLCVYLLLQAAQHPARAVPVIVNLANFSSSNASFEHWLFSAMRETLARPEAFCEMLYRQRRVILLFDGLDEVSPERRAACVEALNALVPQVDQMVVCSRLLEYQALTLQLGFDRALVLQPISPAQAIAVLQAEGQATAGICAAIQRDEMFAELLTTPLLLHVTMIAFANQSAVTIKGQNPDELRRQLWDVYIQRMFEQRTLRKHTPAQSQRWLRWLAETLHHQNETVFWVEQLQPRALTRLWLFRLIYGLAVGLLGGLAVGLFGGFFSGLVPGVIYGLVGGLVGGLFGGLFGGLLFGGRKDVIAPVERLQWSWTHWRSQIKRALVFGLFVGLLGGVLLGLVYRHAVFSLVGWLGVGVLGGMVFGLVDAGWMKGVNTQKVQPNQGIRASLFNGLREWLVLWLTGVLGGGLVNGLLLGRIDGLVVVVIGVVVGVAIGGLLVGLFGGRLGDWLVFVLGGGLFFMVGGWLLDGYLFGWLGGWMVFGLFSGLAVGLGGGLFGGLDAFLKHYILRFVLWREGKLPLRCVDFLENCCALLLLKRFGGAYQFYHISLRDHFADPSDRD